MHKFGTRLETTEFYHLKGVIYGTLIICNLTKKHSPLPCKESELIMWKASNSPADLSSKLSPIFKEKITVILREQKNTLLETKGDNSTKFCEVGITLIQNMLGTLFKSLIIGKTPL